MYLNCHSYHSLRYGTIPLEELVHLAKANGVTAFALTDINTITGIYDFVKSCNENTVKPLVGMEFRNSDNLLYIGIATRFEGVGEMNRIITAHNLNGTPIPSTAPMINNVIIIYPLDKAPAALRTNEFIGIRPDELTLLYQKQYHERINKMVILSPVTIRDKEEFELHKILRAIDHNTLISKLNSSTHCHVSEMMINQDWINHSKMIPLDHQKLSPSTKGK